jgi:CelD/BcsL family acetyltransferase involved in cellulose biosynthesis
MNIGVREVRDEREFTALAPQWRDLFARAADTNIFLSHEWLHAWWTAYRPRAQLRILVVEQDGRVIGIAPLMLGSEWRSGLPVRVLRFIGDGTHETDHVSFVVDRERWRDACDHLLSAIDAIGWDIAEFNQIPETGACTPALLEHAAARWLWSQQVVPSLQRAVPDSYEALLASLPSRARTSLRSTRRRLELEFKVDFGLHSTREELPAALEALFANHASRWRAKGQAGVFQDARKRAFYLDLSQRLIERGWLRFYFLKLDGRIVAQEFCFEHEGVVMLLQEGFDYDLAKHNIGNALRAMVFEHLIKTGSRIYDFLPGDSRHKRSWSDRSVNDLRIVCLRRSVYGRLHQAAPRAVDAIKDFVRPWRDRLRGAADATTMPAAD